MSARPQLPGAWTLRLAAPALPPLEDVAGSLEESWETGALSGFGPRALAFEEVCRQYTGLERVRGVSSADIGLTLAIAALGLPRGATAVVPSFSFNSTLHALLWNGLRPRFADVDPGTWCLTAETAEAAMDDDTAIVVGTHAFASACDVDGLERLTRDRGAALLFDAAQAFATWVGARHIGAFGDASVFSFSASKVVTCGEGGLVAMTGADADARLDLLRRYGSDATYESIHVGLNGKLSELHAAIGCMTVPGAEEQVALRAELLEIYRERLGAIGIGVQTAPDGMRVTPNQAVFDMGERRDQAEAALAAEGIETRTYFRPLHEMPRFAGLPATPLPITERLGRALLTLPLHGRMTPADAERVCDVLESALG
jgi:dTDP-4-amino-4,6-dideoxygalactose transaminase